MLFSSILLLPLLLLNLSFSAPVPDYAVDFTDPLTLDQLFCLDNANYKTIITRVSGIDGEVDEVGLDNMLLIHNSILVTMRTAVYLTPQVNTTNGAAQINKLYRRMYDEGIHEQFLYIQVTKASVPWSSNTSSNIALINSLITHAHLKNFIFGILTSHSDWAAITKNAKTLAYPTNLWYSNVYGPGVTGESQQNFGDYVAYGPWSKTSVVYKQFAIGEVVCGLNVNRNVYGWGL